MIPYTKTSDRVERTLVKCLCLIAVLFYETEKGSLMGACIGFLNNLR